MAETYCAYIQSGRAPEVHVRYHNREYGFPIREDAPLFERLVLEINQAGLSWTTILNKAENFRRAYEGFEIDRVAAYGEADIERLLGDAGIIRNRLKVAAAISNAQTLQKLRLEYGSFDGWLRAFHPRRREEWTRLFKKTFRFTGGEIVHEFLMSVGYLPGAHEPGCPLYAEALRHSPPWSEPEAQALFSAPLHSKAD